MEFVNATSVDEALLAKREMPGAEFLAGGTDLMVEVNLGQHRPEGVISIGGLEGLTDITDTKIGAGVTWARLENSSHQALAHLARTVGSPQIRAAGTFGGNIATASPAGDGHPWLAAIDAEIEVASEARGSRTIAWDEFFTGVKQSSMEDDEMVTSIVLPEEVPPEQHFAKIGVRSAMVISTVCAVVTRGSEGFRLAFGSVGPTVVRARRAEEMINSEASPSEAAINEMAVLVSQDVTPITDHRSTEAYRRHAAGVLAKRLVKRCLA